MSMITGCPACGTMFKVVPDQLKISDGWVRCGHCAEVFDAGANMVPAAVLRDAGVTADDDGFDPSRADMAGDPAGADRAVDTPHEHAFEEPQASAGDRHDPTLLAPPPQDPIEADRATAEAAPIAVEAAVPARLVRADTPGDDEDSVELEDVGFIRKARRRAFWTRPTVRVLLLLVSLALAALLTAQFAVEERDSIAAMHPELRPWLEKLCEPLACAIRPPRRIESIAIDSSTFSKLRADTYRLSLTLKNQAQQPVAIPAIELTLTDTQDQPVVRRVLQPRELGAAAETIVSGGEWSASTAMAVSGGGSGRIAGYRLLAFYP